MTWRENIAARTNRLRARYPVLERHPVWSGLGAVCVVFILLILTAGLWLKPIVEMRASSSLGRPVSISYLNVDLIPHPRVTAEGITVANPKEFPEDSQFGSIERLQFRVDLLALLTGHLRMPELLIDKPKGDLRAGPSGKSNWIFKDPDDIAKEPTAPLNIPKIGKLTINDGDVRLADPKRKIDVAAKIRTQVPPKGGEELIIIDIKGRYAGEPITAHFTGGSVLMLRDDAKPYPVTLTAANGDTRIKLNGSVDNPLDFRGADLRLELQGKDMSKLYPLIGVPLAPTPPYHLTGSLDYHNGRIRFSNFVGTVGESDLTGKFEVDPGKDRPLVTADLASKRVVLADLGGFIGATPGKVDTPNQSAEQKAEHRRKEASPKFLPDTPINLPKIRAADFHVTYKGLRIEGESTPLDNLVANLIIDNGKITLKPLKFGIGTGEIRSNITVDASQNDVRTNADIDFRRVDLNRLMESTGIFEGAGRIGGHAIIDTTGKSLAEMLARGDGELQLFMVGGNISSLLVNLAGLDFGSSLMSLLQLPPRTEIRCMVSDFGMKKGLLQTRMLLFDTDAANLIGKGTINLANEMVDYEIDTDPKHFSIGALGGPIIIKGPMKDLSIGPDAGAVATRAAPAIALSVLLTPLVGLLPTIQLGLGEDNDCVTLIRQHRPKKPQK